MPRFNTLLIIILLITGGCATKTLHLVRDPVPLELQSYNFSVSDELKNINWSGRAENSSFYVKNGAGLNVVNFLLIKEKGPDFKAGFFGSEYKSKKAIKSSTEQINEIDFLSDIYTYDFRFKRGGEVMELIDESVNRSCGLVKVYTSAKGSLQVSYGKVVDCAVLKMSLKNYKQFKISNLLMDLNESVKRVFSIEKI